MDVNNDLNYEQLLNRCFEIEGLISLMRYRETETPAEVEALLREKVADFAAAFAVAMGDGEPEIVADNYEATALVEAPLPSQPEPQPQEESEEEEEEEEEADEPEADELGMTLERKLARDGSIDLRNAFSLNDKFRFRRELFGNSDAAFLDTLNLISAMGSYAEAEEYLYGDLHWNPEGDDVVDFMAIVRDHFDACNR